MKNYLAFDFEWDIQTGEIYCAAFVDDQGNELAIHASEYLDKRDFLAQIKQAIPAYPISVGYYTIGDGSDLDKLHGDCIRNGLSSIVNPTKKEVEAIPGRVHIDLHAIFDKLVVKNYIYKKMYKDMKLESVAQALLGEGKLGTGGQAGAMTIEQVKEYCLQDARLTMKLSKVGNKDKKTKLAKLDGELMKLMEKIAVKTDLSLAHVCHYGMSSIWRKIYRDEGMAETPRAYRPKEGEKRTGPFIMTPIAGDYRNTAILDVASLYPAIVANHNISPDSMNCDCCSHKENPNRVNSAHTGEPIWTCERRQGTASRKTKEMRLERIDYKHKGDKVMADGLKIVMNAETGLFNNAFFEFADYRCYDAIIAWERIYIEHIIAKGKQMGMEIVYSDTDSIFANSANPQAIAETIAAMKEEGIELEHEKTYARLLLLKKKHYIGITDEGEIVVAGMEGEKNDRPKWINLTFEQFTKDYKAGLDVTVALKASYKMFEDEKVPIELLARAIKISKNPEDYDKESISKQVGYLAHAKAGDVVRYWDTKDGPVVEPPAYVDLDKKAYEELFKSTFADALEQLGKSIEGVTVGQTSLFQTWQTAR